MRNLINLFKDSFIYDLNNFKSSGKSYLDLHRSKRFFWNIKRSYRTRQRLAY
ncbi:MAG: hypothetical protein ACPGR7_00945 [Flavobacteriaceae bacterium]